MSNAERSIVLANTTDGHLPLANAGVRSAGAESALEHARPAKTRHELVCRTSSRVFGSPHLPVPIPHQSADDERLEPCAPRDINLATAWIIAWAFAVFILAAVMRAI